MTSKTKRVSLLGELWLFMRQNKKWWMIPILLFFLMLTGIVILGATGAAPLMYTLF